MYIVTRGRGGGGITKVTEMLIGYLKETPKRDQDLVESTVIRHKQTVLGNFLYCEQRSATRATFAFLGNF